MTDDILNQVSNYYTNKINEFGVSPMGVDWNSEQSQNLRFEQLCSLLPEKELFTVLDYGCGYGALYDYLSKKKYRFNYTGYDLSDKMIEAARARNSDNSCEWFCGEISILPKADFVIASGIFNVKLDKDLDTWQNYVETTLRKINNLSKRGFSFNILTKYSDAEFMKEYLYYADPAYYFDFCKTYFSRNVAILHDYDLYEFSIRVRK